MVGGGGPHYGIIVTSTSGAGWELTLDQVVVEMFDFAAPRIGILVENTTFHQIRLQDVFIAGPAENAPMTGVRVSNGSISLDRARIFATPTLRPFPTAIAVQLVAGATATVERSALRSSGAFAEVAAGSTLRIAHTLLEGSLVGTVACFSNYDPAFAPANC
jgi:hypothetical protein